MANIRTPDQILKELREKIATRKALALKMLRTLPQGLSTYNPTIMTDVKDADLFVPGSDSRKAFDKLIFIAKQAGTHNGNAGIIESIQFQESVFIALTGFENQLEAYTTANEDQAAFAHPDRETLRELNAQMEEKISSEDPTGKFSIWAEETVNQLQDVQLFVERARLKKTFSMDHAVSIYEDWASSAETALNLYKSQLPKVAALEKQVAAEQALVQQTMEEYDRDHKGTVNNYKDDVKRFNDNLSDATDTRGNLVVRHTALLAGKPSTEAELNNHIQQCEQLEKELGTSDQLFTSLSTDNRALADRKTVLDESLKQLTGHGHIMGDSPAARLRRKAALEIERMEKELRHARSQLDHTFANEPKYQPLPYEAIAREAAERLSSSKEVLEKEVNDNEVAKPFIASLHQSVKGQIERNDRPLMAFATGIAHEAKLDVTGLINEYRAKRFEMLHAQYNAPLEAGLIRTATDLRKARIAKLDRAIATLESDVKNLNREVANQEAVKAAKARVEKCKQTVQTKKAEISEAIDRLSIELAKAKKLIDDLIVLPTANAVPQERFTVEREQLVAHKEKLIQQRDRVIAERQANEASIVASGLDDAALDQIRQSYENHVAKPKAPESRGSILGAIAAAVFAPVAYFTGLFTAPYDAYRKAKESTGSTVAAVFAGIGGFFAGLAGGWFYGIYRIATGAPKTSEQSDLQKPLLADDESDSSSLAGTVTSSATASAAGSPVVARAGYASGNEESTPNSPAPTIRVHHLHLPTPSKAISGRAQTPKSGAVAAHSAPESEWHPTVSQTVTPHSGAAAALERETRKALHTRERDSRTAVASPERNGPQHNHD